MKTLKTLAVLALVAGAFAGGYLVRASRRGPSTPAGRRVLYYVDAMNPAFRSDKPGLAPDGMALQPVYADALGAPPAAAGGPGGVVPARGAVRISPERQQLIGVTFATAELNDEPRTIRTVGKVTYDETRVVHVHTRIDGWIEQVFVNFTGAVVTDGQPMLTIYSPEMLASEQELLLAARARDLMRNNPLTSAAEQSDSLFQAAKRRLELWQLSEDQIQQLLATGEPIRSVTLHAPASGFVTERKAFPNQKVTPESDLYTIADLSRIWIMADVFESDIASVKVGDAASVLFPSGSRASLSAKVNYIQPEVDPMTRTLRVRLDANNPGFHMKPDMFVNVEFSVRSVKQLVVPAEAVLDTGNRQTVFVDIGNGYLEPRQVLVGARLGDRAVITQGLSAGERVVASGTFLIDSESQLKAATQSFGAPSTRSAAPETTTPAGEGQRHD